MRSVLIICVFVLIFHFAKSDGGFVSKSEFTELRRTVDFLHKSYIDEKTKSENLQRQLVDLQRKYAKMEKRYDNLEYELLKTKSRLDKVEKITTPTFLIQQEKNHYEKKHSGSGENLSHLYNDTLGENIRGRLKQPVAAQENKEMINKERGDKIVKSSLSPQNLPKRAVDPTQQVAFTVRDVVDRNNLGYHQTVVFKTVVTNIGNDYHQPTGTFVCNVPGVYVFYFTVILIPSSNLNVALTKDGTDITYTYYDLTKYTQASNMGLIHLNAGDQVWVRVTSAHASNGNTFGDIENAFSGFLLYPDM